MKINNFLIIDELLEPNKKFYEVVSRKTIQRSTLLRFSMVNCRLGHYYLKGKKKVSFMRYSPGTLSIETFVFIMSE